MVNFKLLPENCVLLPKKEFHEKDILLLVPSPSRSRLETIFQKCCMNLGSPRNCFMVLPKTNFNAQKPEKKKNN